MCFAAGEFRVGAQDVLMGEIAGCKFYIGANQFEYWRHTQLIIDVVPGRGAGFTLEAPEGVRFLTRSRVFTDAEVEALAEQGEPAHGGERTPFLAAISLSCGRCQRSQFVIDRLIYPKNRIWPVPVWRRIGHFQWDDPGSSAYRRSPHR